MSNTMEFMPEECMLTTGRNLFNQLFCTFSVPAHVRSWCVTSPPLSLACLQYNSTCVFLSEHVQNCKWLQQLQGSGCITYSNGTTARGWFAYLL